MIYKLVCAGDNYFDKLYSKNDEEIIIAIDGGYEVLKKLNIKVDYYFGDHDSLDSGDIASNHLINYNPIKDDSDFDLAIKYLIEELKISRNDEVYVYNATGGRLDHYYAILNTIINYNDYKIYLYDDNNKIFMINGYLNIKKNNYKYISFFSVENETIISLRGMKYNVNNYCLKIGDNLCLSNEIIDEGIIETNRKLLVIQSN